MRRRLRCVLAAVLCLLVACVLCLSPCAGAEEPAWRQAHLEGPLSAEQTRAFMRELAQFVFDHHLKKNHDSPQRGMVYEYFDVARKGQFDQFVQGEGLDTMHDGAWLGAAMVNAYRATGDDFYKSFLTDWQLPFYLKMLNHSDELFTASRNDARPGSTPWGKPWALQEGEEGFVPYFWDDGGSVSIERRREKNPLGPRPCVDHLAGKTNPHFLLNGYSQGMSNHMALDMGVLVQMSWLLLRNGNSPADRKLAAEIGEAAHNLHECRMRHFGFIPMCAAPAAMARGNAELMRRVPPADLPQYWTPNNHYVRSLAQFTPGQQAPTPGFADDQQYRYYYGIAKASGQVPDALAFKTVYDAFTERLLYRYYCDDAPVPAGINRLDLHPYAFIDGKPTDYRSDRKGPFAGPRPIGSRMGPQTMVCCGWALQILRERPDIWEARYEREFAADTRVFLHDPPPLAEDGTPRYASLGFDEPDVAVAATRNAFLLRGTFPGPQLVVKVFGKPDAEDLRATITADHNGSVTATDPAGKPLETDGTVNKTGGQTEFTLTLPFTVTKSQRPWLNMIEHGRYSIGVGQDSRNLYVASSREQVQAWLAHELGAGLRTWQAIFEQMGYIPTGMNAGFIWDGLSDSGGYAHLISAGSQWLLYLDGRCDWKVHDVPTIAEPSP